MRRLVEDIRQALSQGPVSRATVQTMESLVASAVPRLQATSLCKDPPRPGRYLCYRDPDFGFVVMLLVWGPGDGTAIHDHGVWGVEAVLKNSLRVTTYCNSEVNPQPQHALVIEAGAVMHNLPPDRDVHKVEQHGESSAVSLHIYGREMTNNRQFVPGEGFKACALQCRDICGELKSTFSLHDLPQARAF